MDGWNPRAAVRMGCQPVHLPVYAHGILMGTFIANRVHLPVYARVLTMHSYTFQCMPADFILCTFIANREGSKNVSPGGTSWEVHLHCMCARDYSGGLCNTKLHGSKCIVVPHCKELKCHILVPMVFACITLSTFLQSMLIICWSVPQVGFFLQSNISFASARLSS